MKARIQNSVSARCGSTCPRRRTYARSGGGDKNEQERKCIAFPFGGGGEVRYESGEVDRENWEVCRESWEVRSKNREVGSKRRGISKETPLLF